MSTTTVPDNVIPLRSATRARPREITVTETTARLRAELAFAEWLQNPTWGLSTVLLRARAYRQAWLDAQPKDPT